MKIQLTLNVPEITTKEEGEDFAVSLSEHILDTFNDDESIDPLIGIAVLTEEV